MLLGPRLDVANPFLCYGLSLFLEAVQYLNSTLHKAVQNPDTASTQCFSARQFYVALFWSIGYQSVNQFSCVGLKPEGSHHGIRGCAGFEMLCLGLPLLVGSVSACNPPLIHPRLQLSETSTLVKAAPLWMLLFSGGRPERPKCKAYPSEHH